MFDFATSEGIEVIDSPDGFVSNETESVLAMHIWSTNPFILYMPSACST